MTTLSDDLGTEGRRLVGVARENRPFESSNAASRPQPRSPRRRREAARWTRLGETEAAMRRFLAKHAATPTGTLSCFDRLLFKGHLPLGYRRYGRAAGW
jgi:hypothetical protein